MRMIRLNLESLEDRCMPSTLGAMLPNIGLVEQQFAAIVPVMQQQLQGQLNVATNLVKTLPPTYQSLAAQPLAEAQAFVNAFPAIAWNWFTQQVAPYELLFGLVGIQPPTDGGSTGNSQAPAHPQSGLSRVWTFPGTSLDTTIWDINSNSNYFSTPNVYRGILDPSHVSVQNGYLRILLTQLQGTVGNNPQGVISTGGLISTKQTYGYGTYEFCARMASTAASPLAQGTTVPGSLSGLFNWVNNSQTEIDMEAYGGWPNYMGGTSYKNLDPHNSPYPYRSSNYFPVPGVGDGFQIYKFVWTPTDVTFYVNDQYKATLTNFVGSTPAHLFVTLFGQDSSTNPASPGTSQYLYVQWIRYTAPGDAPLPVPT